MVRMKGDAVWCTCTVLVRLISISSSRGTGRSGSQTMLCCSTGGRISRKNSRKIKILI
jgi:hypothetical protein